MRWPPGSFSGAFCRWRCSGRQLKRLRAVGRPALGWRDEDVRRVLVLMAPRLFAYGINTINLTFATRFATQLGTSNVSRLYFANRLKELVLGGFAVALATAILPLLSRQALAKSREEFKATLAFALRLIAFVTVPATVGLIVLRLSILRVLLQGGEFQAQDTRATAGILATLSAGLFFFAVVRVVVPAFYALKDTRLPVLAAFADCRRLPRGLRVARRADGLAGNRALGVDCRRRQRPDPSGDAPAAGGIAQRPRDPALARSASRWRRS